MVPSHPRFVRLSNGILFSTVVPGTILAIVGSFLKWYTDDEGGSRKGTDFSGVSVTILAISCLLTALVFIGLRGRPAWLLGMVFVLALVAAADAGNWVALIEQEDGLSTAAGLYMAITGLGLVAVGASLAFLLTNLGGADNEGTSSLTLNRMAPEPTGFEGPDDPAESGLDS